MKITHLFPMLLILLDIGASAMYVSNGEWKQAVYWLAAAVLNICVTF
jgi:hypothetical protein